MRTFLVITLIAAASAAGWNTYQAPPTYKAPAKPTAPKVDFATAEDIVETIFPADKSDSCPEGTAQYSKSTTSATGGITTAIVCIPCAANGCMNCNGLTNTDPLSYLTCQACDAGFGKSGDLCRRCSDISPNCKACGDEGSSICNACNDGFFVQENGPNSVEDACVACGDTVHSGIYQCTACGPSTDAVEDTTPAATCSACATGYSLIPGEESDEDACNLCDAAAGYVDDLSAPTVLGPSSVKISFANNAVTGAAAHCVKCPTGCATCSSAPGASAGAPTVYTCLTCTNGSAVKNGACPSNKPTKPTYNSRSNNYNNKYRGW